MSSIIDDNKWKWASGRRLTFEVQELVNATPTTFLPNQTRKDSILWLGNNSCRFSVKSVYDHLSKAEPMVKWEKLIWFKGYIPRCAFIAWLVCRERLATKAKLKTWTVIESDNCGLYGVGNETMEHLFFTCPVSYDVRNSIMALCAMYRGAHPQSIELEWWSTCVQGNSFAVFVKKLAPSSTIYQLWKARNDNSFRNARRSTEQIVQEVIKDVCAAMGRKRHIRNSRENWKLGVMWGFDQTIFV